MAEIVWSPRAVKDIIEIAEYISKDSLQYAKAQTSAFITVAVALEKHPYKGRIVPELGISNIRQILCGHYRIIYEIFSIEQVGIITVHHQARLLRNNPEVRKFRKK